VSGAALADLPLPGSPADLNLPWTRSLGDRQGESQDAIVVARADVLGVDRRTEPKLAPEAPLRPLANEELVAFVLLEPTLGAYGEHLVLDGHVIVSGWTPGRSRWTKKLSLGGRRPSGSSRKTTDQASKDNEQYEALRREGASKEKALESPIRVGLSRGQKGGSSSKYDDWSKQDLEKKAKEVGSRAARRWTRAS